MITEHFNDFYRGLVQALLCCVKELLNINRSLKRGNMMKDRNGAGKSAVRRNAGAGPSTRAESHGLTRQT